MKLGMISLMTSALACSMLLQPVCVMAEEPDAPAETACLQKADDQIRTDAEGHLFCMDGAEYRKGKFTLSPNYRMGDINQDAHVDAGDAAFLLRVSANAGAAGAAAESVIAAEMPAAYTDEMQICAYADANEDGTINSSDAAVILLHSAESGAGSADGSLGTYSYWADENGWIRKGVFKDAAGTSYYADDKGHLCCGRIAVDGTLYYFDREGGFLPEGWQTVEGELFYVNADGSLTCNAWAEYQGCKRYLNASGAAVLGFTRIGDDCYDLGETGPLTGWQDAEDGRRYFDPETGVMATGWTETEQGRAFLQEDGTICTGWQEIDGKRYYFTDDGIMVKDRKIGDIQLGHEGTEVSEMYYASQQKAEEAFASYGTSVEACYNFVRDTTRYKRMETDKSIEQIERIGWLYFVDYAMKNRYVVCYYLAAKMDFMLQEAGYESRIVYASHSTGKHYWNQVNIDGEWVNYDLTSNMYAKTWEQMEAYGHYKLIRYITPEYS